MFVLTSSPGNSDADYCFGIAREVGFNQSYKRKVLRNATVGGCSWEEIKKYNTCFLHKE